MNKETAGAGGTSLGTTLATVFVILKLTNVINWSWVWVLSPWWISFTLTTIIVLILSIASLTDDIKKTSEGIKKRNKDFAKMWGKHQ